MRSFCYRAYGLTFQSHLPLPGLLPAENRTPDVSIGYGEIPAALPDPATRFGIWEAAPNKFLLNVSHVARYLILNGQEIRIEAAPESTEDDIRTFLLSSALAALLQQRHILTLHASAIQTAQGAVLFLGSSGSGKSTLLAGLLKRGYAMLTDDVTGIIFDGDGCPLALPAFPVARLWADAVAQLDYAGLARRWVRAELEKYLLPVNHFWKSPLPVCAAYVLTSHNQVNIQFEELKDIGRFKWLCQYTYRKRFLRGLELEPIHFRAVTTITRQVKMTRVIRPAHPFLLNELVDRLEQDFRAQAHMEPNSASYAVPLGV
ncbi:MAG: hypothetical protein QNJ46_29835 [Leptolyngbyaceae cyanobacterium MO_188.B28]|nr:hypothetical protein [Leptolyngbyaceae cyanobacterium MO_188.B28]